MGAAADHPLAQEPLTLGRRVAQDGDSALVDALAGIGRQRQVRLTIPSTRAALAIVGETDLTARVPWRMAIGWADHYRLKWMEPPYPGPETQLSMVWHLGHASDPALKWLRQTIAAVANRV